MSGRSDLASAWVLQEGVAGKSSPILPILPILHFRPLRLSTWLAYGAGVTLAGPLTFALGLRDAWSLLGSGAGVLIVTGALRLVGRTLAMQARTLEELEFRRILLALPDLTGSEAISTEMS